MRVTPKLAILLLTLAWVSPAQGQTKKELRDAQAAIETGQDHFRAEQYTKAVAEFRRALQVVQDPGLIWNIARSYEELEDFKNAVHYFEEFVRRFPKDKDASAAEKRAAALRPKLPASVVVECGAVPGGRVVVDGAHKVACGERVVGLRPGAHVAELMAPGRETLSLEFFLGAGERLSLGFDDLVALQAAASETAATADSADGGGMLGPSLFVAAGALAIGAVVFALMSRNARQELEDLEQEEVRLSQIRDLEDKSAGTATVANVLFAGALSTGVAGALFTW